MYRKVCLAIALSVIFAISTNAAVPKRNIPRTASAKFHSYRLAVNQVNREATEYLIRLDRDPSMESKSKSTKLRLLTKLRGIEIELLKQQKTARTFKLLKNIHDVREKVKRFDQAIENKKLLASLIAQSKKIRLPERPAIKHLDTPTAGSISGTVTDAGNSSPLNSVEIDIYDSDGYWISYGYTDSSGNYSVPVDDGTYFVATYTWDDYVNELYDNIECDPYCDPTQGTPVVVSGAPVSGIDFALLHAGQITGTITDSVTNAPLQNIDVYIYDSDGYIAGYATTNANGNYSSEGRLSTGNYFAIAYDWTYVHIDELYKDLACPEFCDPLGGTPISVTTGSITPNINFTLDPSGSISGTVTSEDDSQPVFALVFIYDSNGNYVSYAYTDDNGAYKAGGLGTGTYFAATSNYSGYVDELYDNIMCPFGTCDVQSGTPISVTFGQETTGVNFALATAGVLRGTVTDEQTSAPIEDVGIEVYDSNGYYAGFGYTDPSGNYSVAGLMPGNYFAVTYVYYDGYLNEIYDNIPCDGWCDPLTGTPIPVTLDQDSIANFKLSQGGKIAGKVTDAATGQPIEWVGIDVYDSGGNYVSYAYTDTSGNYEAPGLATGSYHVATYFFGPYTNEVYDNHPCDDFFCDPSIGDPVSVTVSQTTAGIDFALDPGGTISGIVTDYGTGQPITEFAVLAYNDQGYAVSYAFSNDDGTYKLEGLPTGNYFVETYNYENYLDELYDNIPCNEGFCNPLDGTPIAVTTGQDTPGINFALDHGGTISGKVTDNNSVPLEYVGVEIYDINGNFVSYGYTDASGNYKAEYPGLQTGTYFAQTYTFYGEYLDELYDNIPCPDFCDPTTGTPISVTTGSDTGNIDFALDHGGAIAGKVIDGDTGQPISGVFIDVFDTAGNWVSFGYTDSAGNYTTYSDLATGNYFVMANDYFGEYDAELYDNIPCPDGLCDPTTGTPVAVVANNVTNGINFVFGECVESLITPSSLPNGVDGVMYNQQILASGGPTPYTFKVVSGTLPNGISLNQATGSISGVPTIEGAFSFTIGAIDAVGCESIETYSIQVTSGNVQFSDDFEDGVLATNWTYKGSWQETSGKLSSAPAKKAIAIADPAFQGCTNCSVNTQFQTDAGGRVSVFGWYQNKSNSVELLFKEQENRVLLKQRSNGQIVAKSKANVDINPNVSYQVAITFDGTNFIVSVQGQNVITMPAGGTAFGTIGYQIKGTAASFDSIAVN
jgi:5-hydroxyisourate hydrolase-like protein (transthyretin family)